MDYKKRNEEILEKLRTLRDSWASTNNRAAKEIEEAIPELVESEDERIRKEIIDFATKANNGVTSILANNYNFNKWIALLEKQAEQKTVVIIPKFRVGDKIRRKTPCRYDKDMQVTRIESNYYLCNHLGKFSSESISFSEESNYELVEQKPAKVEPKFKVGDWVIDVQGVSTNQIIGYEDDSYHIKTSCSKFYLPMKLAEKNYRPWTIQDAKDGDILYAKISDEEWLYLYNSLIDDTDFPGLLEKAWINSYCCYRQNDSWSSYEKQEAYQVNEYSIISPATKEQRDTLMKAMADAGYEWDAEKKELRKVEPKPDWSERDKEKFQIAIDTLVEAGQHDSAHWLKSLKERVQHQNMWISVDKEVYIKEPILAQKKDKTDPFKGYVVCCDHTLDPLVFERYINIENISTQSLWRPSNEQMDALNDVISSRDIKYDVLSELWKDLNKLKD